MYMTRSADGLWDSNVHFPKVLSTFHFPFNFSRFPLRHLLNLDDVTSTLEKPLNLSNCAKLVIGVNTRGTKPETAPYQTAAAE